MPQVPLTGAHPQVAAALAAADLPESHARTICGWTGQFPGSCRDTADAILVTAAAAGRDLRDLAALAAEIQARSRPMLPTMTARARCSRTGQCGWRPRSAAPGSWPGTSPPNAPRW